MRKLEVRARELGSAVSIHSVFEPHIVLPEYKRRNHPPHTKRWRRIILQ